MDCGKQLIHWLVCFYAPRISSFIHLGSFFFPMTRYLCHFYLDFLELLEFVNLYIYQPQITSLFQISVGLIPTSTSFLNQFCIFVKLNIFSVNLYYPPSYLWDTVISYSSWYNILGHFVEIRVNNYLVGNVWRGWLELNACCWGHRMAWQGVEISGPQWL